MDRPAPPAREPGYRARLSWAAALAFASGFPFGVYLDVWPVYFRAHGVSLQEIGMLTLLATPWTWKPLWAPLVDRYGTRRAWAALAAVAMGAILIVHPLFDAADPSALLWGLLLAFTIASATLDIAVDGQTIAFLRAGEEGAANGLRASAYRAALIFSGGGVVLVAGWAGWAPVLPVAGAFLVAYALLLMRSPLTPVSVAEHPPFFEPLLAWIRRPGAGVALAFILLYRIGDFAIAPMLKPFWVDRGMTLAEIATVSTTMGIVAGVVGALIGGFLTSRWGLIPGLWILGATQGLSNLVYWGVASYGGGRPVLYFAGIFESFAQGLATVAFVSLLMRLCDKAQAATQYALLSALYGLPRFIVGPVSGWATEQLGYPSYFLVTVLLSIPAFLFLPRLSDQVQRE